MTRKRVISVFLLLVFLIPVLPVMQVGAWLSQGQMTEELPHQGLDEVSPNDTEITGHMATPPVVTPIIFSCLNNRHCDEQVLSRQADDIQTPPPNWIKS